MDRYTKTRRDFIKKFSVAAAGIGLTGTSLLAGCQRAPNTTLPRWKGFNLLDFFGPDPSRQRPPTKEDYFRWMRDWGFDFVRIPMAYPYYVDFDRSRNIRSEEVYNINEEKVEKIDELVTMAQSYGMHVSLNLHRAPGYCINAGFWEPYNLWLDKEAQEAFNYHWAMWARRYRDFSSEKISFDLVNEPAMRDDPNDQHSPVRAIPGDTYRKVVKGATEAIRSYNPNHLIIAGGNNVGTTVVPELLDLGIAKSNRGYFPAHISHYRAPWVYADVDTVPTPTWPGYYNGKHYRRETLEAHYAPWADIAKQGIGVHCGELGCYNQTPHEVFLAWFTDTLDILKENGIGFALWEFRGDFGILNSRRNDVEYEDWYGYQLDRKLLDLLRKQ